MTKIRVTIDTDVVEDNVSDMGSLEHGVYGCDNEGVYHMFYGSRNEIVEFQDVQILEHDFKPHCKIKDCITCEYQREHPEEYCTCCEHKDDRTPEQLHDELCLDCKESWEE